MTNTMQSAAAKRITCHLINPNRTLTLYPAQALRERYISDRKHFLQKKNAFPLWKDVL